MHVHTVFGVICIFYYFFLYWHAEKMTVETSSSLDRLETYWIRDTDDSTFDYEIHCDLDRRERCLKSIILERPRNIVLSASMAHIRVSVC